MVKRIVIAFLLALPISVLAQNEMKEINEIKSSMDFLYATGTSTVNAEEAANNAKDLIALEIEQWLKEHSVDDVAGFVAKSRESLSQIKTQRGNLYRVFVFVKKIDVLPYDKGEEVMVVDFVNTETETFSEATSNGQCLEQEESVCEVTDPRDSILQTKKEESSVSAQQLSDVEKILLNVNTFSALNDFINHGREDGSILNVGSYKTLPTTGICYVFIHNRDGNIPAHIKCVDSRPINIKTGLEDSISNYKGCGAIWVKFKNGK